MRMKLNCDHVLHVVRKFRVPINSAISRMKKPRRCGPNCVKILDIFAHFTRMIDTVSFLESSSTPKCSLKLDRAISTNLSSSMDDFRMAGLGDPSMRKLDSILDTIASLMNLRISAIRLSSTCMFILVTCCVPLWYTPRFSMPGCAGVIATVVRGSVSFNFSRYVMCLILRVSNTGLGCFKIFSPMAVLARARGSQLEGLVLLPNVCPVGTNKKGGTTNPNKPDTSGCNLIHLKAELTSSSHRYISSAV